MELSPWEGDRLSNQSFVGFFHGLHAHSSHSIWFDNTDNIWWRIHNIEIHPPVTLSLLGPNIILSALFSNIPDLISLKILN